MLPLLSNHFLFKLLQMKNIVLIFIMFYSIGITAQNKEAYKIFNSDGNISSYDSLLNACKDADFVFFGEDHSSSIAHWLQIELTADLFKLREKDLVIGAEMFEADVQLIINEYLNGRIKNKDLETEARIWPNYKTDYKPIVQFCKKNNIPFIATNIPHRYAAMVSKGGFAELDSLSNDAKKFIAPLPIEYDENIKCYKSMLEDMDSTDSHYSKHLPKAQAIKDATMAHFILQNYKKDQIFFHLNGSYHSNNKEGILLYLKPEKKKYKVITINTESQKTLSELSKDAIKSADFIICIPENMPGSY